MMKIIYTKIKQFLLNNLKPKIGRLLWAEGGCDKEVKKKSGLYQAKSASLGDCRGSYQAGYLRPGISRWTGSRLTLGRG